PALYHVRTVGLTYPRTILRYENGPPLGGSHLSIVPARHRSGPDCSGTGPAPQSREACVRARYAPTRSPARPRPCMRRRDFLLSSTSGARHSTISRASVPLRVPAEPRPRRTIPDSARQVGGEEAASGDG